MKIEPGKEYRTRDGHKARVYAVDCGRDAPIQGAVFKEGQWIPVTWKTNGKFWSNGESDADLIAEWIDEPQEFEAWVNGDKISNMGFFREDCEWRKVKVRIVE